MLEDVHEDFCSLQLISTKDPHKIHANRTLTHVARFEAEIQNDDNNVVLKEVIRRSPGFEFEAFQALLIMSYERGGKDRQARRYCYSSEVHLLEDGLDEGWLVRKA